ncbi:MAG: YraN family protein [Clostridia bacterium]|nr:YraN family protein [Clostridia bacterium]
MNPQRYEKGLAGEEMALRLLLAKGMTELARRFRAGDGEVDLVLADGATVVFAEVKYRPSGRRGDGLMAVTPSKQRRMTHAAQAFLIGHDLTDRPVRFDVVEITAEGALHIPNAFWPGAT